MQIAIFIFIFISYATTFNSSNITDCQNSYCCQTCEDTDPNPSNSYTCSTCELGCGFVGTICSNCPQQCSQCSQPFNGNCTQCKNDYFMSSVGFCSPNCSKNCQRCDQPNTCSKCIDNYRIIQSTEQCTNCTPNKCVDCPANNVSHCLECQFGYGFIYSTRTCRLCTTKYCVDCDHFMNCTSCRKNYRLNRYRQCIVCTDPNDSLCLYCTNNKSICSKCRIGSYLNSTTKKCVSCVGDCGECNVNNCEQCYPTNSSACLLCENGFGLTSNNKCRKCTEEYCEECLNQYTSCSICETGLGVYQGKCINCHQAECLECGKQFNECIFCYIGYGPNQNSLCIACEKQNCQNCSIDSSVCLDCKSTYILIGEDCRQAENPCQNYSHPQCYPCSQAQFFSSYNCQPCMKGCLRCSSNDSCLNCTISFYENPPFGFCTQCSQNCENCYYNLTKKIPICTKCFEHFFLDQNNNTCLDVCGDSVVISLQCDNAKGIDYDGCDDSCKVMQGFECQNVSLSNKTWRSKCSYNGSLELEISKFSKEQFKNAFTFVVTINPPIYALMSSTKQNLYSLFTLHQQPLTINQISLISHNQILISASYKSPLTSPLLFSLQPKQEIDERYFATTQTIEYLDFFLPYYSSFAYAVGQIIWKLSITAVTLGWVAAIGGMVVKKLVGLEALITLQIGFTSILFLNSEMYLPFELTEPLKYSFGYSLQSNFLTPLKSSSTSFKETSPFTTLFEFPLYLPFNSLFILTILQCVPIIVLIIAMLYTKILAFSLDMKKQKIKELDDEQKYNQFEDSMIQIIQNTFKKVQILKAWCYQILAYIGMMKLTCFTLSITIFIQKYNASLINNIESIAILSVNILLYIITIVLLYFNPDAFGYFRYQFKRNRLALKNYIFYIIAIISTMIVICLAPKPSYLPMIPFSILLLFTILTRPYISIKQNIKSIFFMVIVLCFLALRVYIEYLIALWSLDRLFLYLTICVSLAVSVGIVAILFEIGKIILVSYEEQFNELQDQNQAMKQMDSFYMQNQMKDVINETIFHKILTPRLNLLEFSNNIINLQNGQNETGTKRSSISQLEQKIQDQNIKMQMPSPQKNKFASLSMKHKMQETKIKRNQKRQTFNVHQNLIDFDGQSGQGNTQRQLTPHQKQCVQKGLSDYLQFEQKKNKMIENGDKNQKKSKEENMKGFVLGVAINENKFLQVRNAEDFLNKSKSEPHEQLHIESFREAYEQIP